MEESHEDSDVALKSPRWLVVLLAVLALGSGLLFIGALLTHAYNSRFLLCGPSYCRTSLAETVKLGAGFVLASVAFWAALSKR